MKNVVLDINRFLGLALVVVVFAASGRAGQLSDNLAREVAGKTANEPIKVWIQLPEVENVATLKAMAGATARTRAGRYKITHDRLQANHITAQRNLLNHLRTLSAPPNHPRLQPPKGHWLVNIIEAEVTVEQLNELALRDDIDMIYPAATVTSITPAGVSSASVLSAGVEDNLSYINAPTAWAAGYTGQGRIVCIFDTGVDGLHPALFDNWKGHDGDAAAAWFDPVGGEPFPHVLPVKPGAVTYHGTATTGLVVGHDDITGDTVGVALDAKWIAAAVADIEGASIIDAFEWAANPDGDPNNIDDVPDVINHSWGIRDIGCQDVFYSMIDATEALGIVNIFAAGNEGSSFPAIRNPANRANDSLDCFAVGNIDHRTSLLSSTSSRGPSDCNGAIKPNVVAPGVLVRFPVPGDTYTTNSGTSFATPHVSGLVALLREKNPNATPDEIKKAILTSTNRLNRSLPNNDYGWGLVDCWAALRALSDSNTEPNVRVFAFDHDPISPGDTVDGSLVLKNQGADVRNITAFAQNSNPSLKVLNGLAIFGDIDEGETVRAPENLSVVVSDTVAIGSILPLDIQVSNSTGYSRVLRLYFLVEQRDKRSMLTHNAGNIEFTVSNFGTLGLGDDSYFDAGGAGFKFQLGPNYLWDGGLMIGRDASHVSDGVMNVAFEPDGDFAVVSSGSLDFVTPVGPASEQTYSRFADSRAENPLNIEVTQVSYAFDDAPYQDMVILRYVIRNTGAAALSNLYVGLHLDWDVGSAVLNAGGYNPGNGSLWIADNSTDSPIDYRGVALLDGTLTTAYTDRADLVVYPPDGISDDGYTEAEKMNSLAKGINSPAIYETGTEDLFQVMAARIVSLPAESADTVAFALVAGIDEAEFSSSVASANAAYTQILAVNVAPEIAPIENMAVLAGSDLSFQVSAIDPNATTPTLRVEDLPSGATFTDSGNGNGGFEWAIGPSQTGTFMPSFIAEDGLNADTETVVITVLDNSPARPAIQVIAVSELTALRGETIEFPVVATDPNGTIPSLSIDTLPSGVTFTDNGNGTADFAWFTSLVDEGEYTIVFIASDGTLADSSSVLFRIAGSLPSQYVLRQNFPNPFNGTTTISFDLETTVTYTLRIYSILGHKVREYRGRGGPGEVRISVDSADMASGVYFYRLSAGGFSDTKKMLLLR